MLSRCHGGGEDYSSTCNILPGPSREAPVIFKILQSEINAPLKTHDYLNAPHLRPSEATPTAGEQQVAMSLCLYLIVVFLTLVLCITFEKNALCHCCALVSHGLGAEEREEPYVYILGRGTLPPPPTISLLAGPIRLSSRQAKFSPADVKYVI